MMKNGCSQSRRSFLKASVASAAGIAVSGGLTKNVLAKESAWTAGMRINPLIDNLKVVSCKDTTYLSGTPASTAAGFAFSNVNSLVKSDRVAANLDEMAKALSGAATPAAAWSTIFQKPAVSATDPTKKAWAQIKVAFKVNCIEPKNMHRIAVINKVALELNKLGVPYTSMFVYDGCHNAGGKYNYTGSLLTAGIKVCNGNVLSTTNTTVSAPVPAPYSRNVNCTADIANGVIDILVNCAVNKAHDSGYGGCTISMKNHFGTFAPDHSYNHLIGLNKSDAIIGGTVPRQQLVIVDSIIAMSAGPTLGQTSYPDKYPYRLIMGTFGPAVDYITGRKIRQLEMGLTPSTVIDDLLIQFNYTPAQRDAMVLTDVPPAPATGVSLQTGARPDEREIRFEVSGNSRKGMVKIPFPSERVREVTIYNMQGKQIRNYSPNGGHAQAIAWDGKTEMGLTVNPGTYVVSLQGGKTERSVKLVMR